MDRTTSGHTEWAEFAETFFNAEEDRKRHAFFARNAIRFLDATELTTVESRVAQSAIPEIADGCLIALISENGEWEKPVVANRYERETEAFQTLAQLPESIRNAFTGTNELRILTDAEVDALAVTLPSITAAAVVPLGFVGAPEGYALFVQSDSERGFSQSELRLIRDLSLYGEQVIFQARATECLRREVREREKFISIASHELKTPLTALKLQIESLQRSFRREGPSLAPEKLERAFSNLGRSIQRIDQSIGMLFNLSEIRAGQVGLLKERGDLAQLVRDVLVRMDSLMKGAGCEVVAVIPDELPAFFDGRRIEQVLTNLLANAAKYAPCSEVHVIVSAEGENAKVRIRDHGPGIPPKNHAKIFDAFTRAGDQPKVEGLGLGLFVAQGVIRAHGGRLLLTSAPGEGACFEIELPLWQA